MELIKLPLHQETIELLKLQGVTFLGDDETFYFRGKDEVKDKWGTFELGLYTEMDIENQYDEVCICTGGETRTLTPRGTRS